MNYKEIKKIKLIVLVCPVESEDALSARLQDLGAKGTFLQRGKGAAPPGILSLLGFSNNDKSVLISTAHDTQADDIMQTLKQEMYNKKGFGVGFTIEADGFAGARMLFREEEAKINDSDEQDNTQSQTE